jgi:hypothetical protein
VYTYPSAKATKYFRKVICDITSQRKIYLDVSEIFKQINGFIRVWSNYFVPGPSQLYLRKYLD